MATVQRDGSEFLVNTQALGNQVDPAIAYAGPGLVVTWRDENSGGDIKAQIFDIDGEPVGSEILVNTQTAAGQFSPSITALTAGRFVIVWDDDSLTLGDASSASVKGQVFEADGTRVGGEFLINTSTSGAQLNPAVVDLRGGDFLVVWDDLSGALGDAGTGIKAQRYSSFGDSVVRDGIEFRVNTRTDGVQQDAAIARLANNGYVVSWTDAGPAPFGDTSGSSIRAQVYGSNDVPIGFELLVNTQTDGDQQASTVAGLSTGGFVVAWQDSSLTLGDTSSTSIKAQLFDTAGVRVGGEFLVNTVTSGAQTNPEVAALNNGRFLITWQSPTPTGGDTSGLSVRGQLFASDGTALGEEFRVNAQTEGNQSAPAIAVSQTGDFGIAWQDASETFGDGSGSSIKAQTYRISEFPEDIALIGGTIAENAAAGAIVGLAVGSDPGDVLTYSLLDDAGGRFLIDATTGLVTVAAGAILDFETTPTLDIVITVTDPGGLDIDETFTIQLTDVDENVVPRDSFNGTSGADSFAATDGTLWTINGFAGNDTLTGADSDDAFFGGRGNDTLGGNGGDDLFYVDRDGGFDTYVGGDGFDIIIATGDDIRLGIASISGIEEISGDVRVLGNAGANIMDFSGTLFSGETTIDGANGADTIVGSAQGDRILGGAGNDAIDGGGGNDILTGGTGIDELTGGDGNDVFTGRAFQLKGDAIVDLAAGDTIEVTDFANASAVSLAYNSALLFIDPDGAGGQAAISVFIGAGYDLAAFSIASNGFGGTLISLDG